jgi:predicted alpha/beta superfamily hydrolase
MAAVTARHLVQPTMPRIPLAAAVLIAMGIHPGCAGQEKSSPSRVETFTLASKVFNNQRSIRVVVPSGYDDPARRDRKYPVQYLNDGSAVFKEVGWNAPQMVSTLIADHDIEPIILVGIDSGKAVQGGSDEQRTREYLPYADAKYDPAATAPRGVDYPRFLFDEVMPAVAGRYRVQSGPAATGIGGSSYGGVAALYTVLHYPGVFGKLLLESTPLFVADAALLKEAAQARSWPERVYIGVGTRETEDTRINMTNDMQTLRATIVEKSPHTSVQLLVVPEASHEERAWRNRLPDALTFLWGK